MVAHMEAQPKGVEVDLRRSDDGFFGRARLSRDGALLRVAALRVRPVFGLWRRALIGAGLLLVVVGALGDRLVPRSPEILIPVGLAAAVLAWFFRQPLASGAEASFPIGCVRLVETDSIDFSRGEPTGGNPFRLAFDADDGSGRTSRFVLEAHDAETVAALLALLTP